MPIRWNILVRGAGAVVVGTSCLLVALRALNRGPIEAPVTIYRPLNLESAAAVGLLLLLFLFGRKQDAAPPAEPARPWELPALCLVLAFTLACYWRSLWWPLTSDDYVIVMRALRGELIAGTFTSGDAGVAFRPLNRFLFAAQGWLGSRDPVWWHGIGLVFHLANCALLFRLARPFAGAGPALTAAALFGLHATHPEAVSWMNSRSDVLAAFFLLAGLLLFLSHWKRPRRSRQLAALVSVAAAILCKETGYVFVPAAWLLAAAKEWPGWRGVRVLVPFVLLEAALFTYRWQVLGGLGGYASPATGRSMILSPDLASTAKALLWRAWAILFFPVNWSVPAGLLLGLALLGTAASLVVLSRGRADRRALAALVGFTAVSIGPVLPLALVGADLFGARVYYLPSAGAALLTAVALEGVRPRELRAAAAALLLLFHFAALRHQLGIWESVTALARRTCVEAAGPILSAAGPEVVVQGIPNQIDGVFFLGNGFAECLEYYSGRRLLYPIVVGGEPSSPSSIVFRWDPSGRRLR